MTLNKPWHFIISKAADRQFRTLDRTIQNRILDFFEHLTKEPNPKAKGSPLKGTLKSFWRYRIGDYRVVCRFEDKTWSIIAIKIGHRRQIYK